MQVLLALGGCFVGRWGWGRGGSGRKRVGGVEQNMECIVKFGNLPYLFDNVREVGGEGLQGTQVNP